mgnify:CR=1 FL=1
MKVLVIAPHADDETIGVGGTIARFSAEGHDVIVAIMTGHGNVEHPIWPKSNWDIVREESKNALKILNVSKIVFRELPAACLDSHPTWEINKVVSDLIYEEDPDQIFVPFKNDLHKDH